MQRQQLILLLQLLLCICGCWAAGSPRLLLRCPADFETVVEPLPASVGDPVLLLGPGVRLRTVGFLQDGALRVESDRLLLNGSLSGHRGPYSGPHVMLCTDTAQPLATFSLFIRLGKADTLADTAAPPSDSPSDPPSDSPSDAPSDAPSDTPSDPRLLALAVTVFLLGAVCVALAVILAVLLLRRRCCRRERIPRTIFTGGSCDSLLSGRKQSCKPGCAIVSQSAAPV